MVAKRILITGANRGLGLEFVKQLLAPPNAPEILFATCRNPNDAKDLDSIVKNAKNTKSHILKMDGGSETDLVAVANFVNKEVGNLGLNLLINNAGIGDRNVKLGDVTAKNMMDHYMTNAVTPVLLTKFLLPSLRSAASQQSGAELSASRAAIINISAGLGLIKQVSKTMHEGSLEWYPYRASKAALNMLSKCMAEDLKKEGIMVIPIHPGWVRTDMGGESGQISVEESVSGMLKVISGASTKDSGVFYTWDGHSSLEW